LARWAGWLLGLSTKELSERLASWIRGPRLKLQFTDTEDCVTLTPEEYQINHAPDVAATQTGKRVVFFARIRVTNPKPRIATRCQAWLIDVETSDGKGAFKPTIYKDSIPLIWSYNAEAETADIAQDVNRYLDLVRIQNDVPGFQPQLRSRSGAVFSPFRYQPLFRDNGTLRFTILVSAQDIKPAKIRVVVSRSEQWPPNAEFS